MRLLICVGCNTYDRLNGLNGAENDASNIFEALTERGNYDKGRSLLSLSPSMEELRKSLRDTLSSVRQPDCLTIYFAGHGGVSRGTYYLCVRDSTLSMLSTTALSLSELFTIVNELEPAQCNLIIDACQSGGLVADLSTLIKPEILGGSNTPGISIFASSSANEEARETPLGGVGTVAILKALTGKTVVQTERPFLDLVEIGRVVSATVSASPNAQRPVVWGLNLFGESTFTSNPHYDSSKLSALGSMAIIPQGSQASVAIHDNRDALWRLYYEMPLLKDARSVSAALIPVITSFGANEEAIGSFVLGYARTLAVRAQTSENTFLPAEILAACAGTLIGYLPKAGIDQAIRLIATEMLGRIDAALIELGKDLAANEFVLIRHATPEFYYLPLRITRILGWIGAAVSISEELGHSSKQTDYLPVVRQLLHRYATSLLSLNDCQSPFVLLFIEAALRRGWKDEAEQVFGHLLSDLIDSQGRIAEPNIAATNVFQFMQRRFTKDFDSAFDLLSQPMELLSVLLMATFLFRLEDLVDPYLSQIDHLSFNVFLPKTHTDFGQETIREGTNHGFQIGHGVWTTTDFVQRWTHSCVSQIKCDPLIGSSEMRIAAICIALTLTDRVPWFLWANRTPL